MVIISHYTMMKMAKAVLNCAIEQKKCFFRASGLLFGWKPCSIIIINNGPAEDDFFFRNNWKNVCLLLIENPELHNMN